MHVIAFTKVALPYGWLGNMAPYPVRYMNNDWRTPEALFQALRFDDYGIRELIRDQKSPMAAKMVAKKHAEHRVVEPMSDEDIANMDKVLRLKLEAHPRLVKDLLATGDVTIVEDCTKRPRGSGLFWGAKLLPDGTWEGQNCLGLLWMNLRNELASNLVGADNNPEVVR